MGWWWRSSPQQDNAPAAPPATPPAAPRKLTPDEQAELEFSQILADLRQEDAALSKSKSPQPPSTGPDGASNTGATTAALQSSTSSIAPESLYSDTMSCRDAFDYAFFCQSFGGQFVNVYRYGELRSCSEHWDNFWMCMRTRQWPDDQKKAAIRDHNRKKAIKYKTGPSSEDVWDVRQEPAPKPFLGDYIALEREMKAEEEAKQQAH
ncbi:hypothetical protein N7510_003587 [Penicillium lagena]|uniref:uncharacterized protein n=1 Tax=Penicillium lagena TaxID=94218 RepID=UPI00254269D2|nr:uncharacterized protein N7510_003587 [Penicillium lagena]KAJ5619603.1 hypothetical protein N7510_003587 [Penicillium lagena]